MALNGMAPQAWSGTTSVERLRPPVVAPARPPTPGLAAPVRAPQLRHGRGASYEAANGMARAQRGVAVLCSLVLASLRRPRGSGSRRPSSVPRRQQMALEAKVVLDPCRTPLPPLSHDQAKATEELLQAFDGCGCTLDKQVYATLHGATGTGKTRVFAELSERLKVPLGIIAPNKVLVKQLYGQMKKYFPNKTVLCFTSKYDKFMPTHVGANGELKKSFKVIDPEAAEVRAEGLRKVKAGRGDLIIIASEAAAYPAELSENWNPKNWDQDTIENFEKRVRQELEETEDLVNPERLPHLQQQIHDDMESIRSTGSCTDFLEKYGKHLPAEMRTLPTLLAEKYGRDWLLVIDESHTTLRKLPQNTRLAAKAGCCSPGRSGKGENSALVKYGHRLPSAAGPPLAGETWWTKAQASRVLFASATPGKWEQSPSVVEVVAEMIHRPTHILDPEVEDVNMEDVECIKYICALIKERKVQRGDWNEQVLVAVTSMQEAEDVRLALDCRMQNEGIPFKADVVHCGMTASERAAVMDKFHRREIQVLVGIGLICEGFDCPMISLVIVLFWKYHLHRSPTHLIQLAGRAARHPKGAVKFVGKKVSSNKNVQKVIKRLREQREKQRKLNEENSFSPRPLPRSDVTFPGGARQTDVRRQTNVRSNIEMIGERQQWPSKASAPSSEDWPTLVALCTCPQIDLISASKMVRKIPGWKKEKRLPKDRSWVQQLSALHYVSEVRIQSVLENYPAMLRCEDETRRILRVDPAWPFQELVQTMSGATRMCRSNDSPAVSCNELHSESGRC